MWFLKCYFEYRLFYLVDEQSSGLVLIQDMVCSVDIRLFKFSFKNI